MKLIIIFLSFLIISCSENDQTPTGHGPKAKTPVSSKKTPESNPSTEPDFLDSDGDMIADEMEIKQRRNPFIADLPIIQLKLVKESNLSSKYINNGTHAIQLIKNYDGLEAEQSFNRKALKIVNLKDTDLFDKDFFNQYIYSFDGLSQEEITKNHFIHTKLLHEDTAYEEIKLRMNVELKSPRNNHFGKITNIVLSLKFFDVSIQQYRNIELRDTLIDELIPGVTKEVSITTIDLDQGVLESFLTNGLYPSIVIDNFTIPSLNTDYQSILKNIEKKSKPVYISTPREDHFFYLAKSQIKNDIKSQLEIIAGENFYYNNENELVSLLDYTNQTNDRFLKWKIIENSEQQLILYYQKEKKTAYYQKTSNLKKIKGIDGRLELEILEDTLHKSEKLIIAFNPISYIKHSVKESHRRIDRHSCRDRANSNAICNYLSSGNYCDIYQLELLQAEFADQFKDNFINMMGDKLMLNLNENNYSLNHLINSKKAKLNRVEDIYYLETVSLKKIIPVYNNGEIVLAKLVLLPRQQKLYVPSLELRNYNASDESICHQVASHIAKKENIGVSRNSINFSTWEQLMNDLGAIAAPTIYTYDPLLINVISKSL